MVEVSSRLSAFLNFLRWNAAFLVVVGHVRGLVFVPYSDLEINNLFIKLFYFMTGLAHEAVIVFFVLSGYLVGGKLVNSYRINRLQWKKYFIKRITRLYIVLIPALIIGGLLDLIGVFYFNESHLYNNAFQFGSLNYLVTDRLNIEHFLSNLFMLQETFTPTFGSNGPLWSLAYEFWYYILLPIMIIMFFHVRSVLNINSILKMIMIIVFAIILIILLDTRLLLYFMLWLLGTVTFFVRKITVPFWLSIVFSMLVLVLGRFGQFVPSLLADFLLAIGIGMMINSYESTKLNIKFVKMNTLLADFSYSVYLFHFPLFILILGIIIDMTGGGYYLQPSYNTYFIFCSIVVLIFIYAFIMYLLFEKYTQMLQNKIMKYFKL